MVILYKLCLFYLKKRLSFFYLCSLLCPTHTRPPCLGEGLLQDRWRTSNPISQLVLHWPQDDQGVHPPFLQKKKEKTVSNLLKCSLFLQCISHDERTATSSKNTCSNRSHALFPNQS